MVAVAGTSAKVCETYFVIEMNRDEEGLGDPRLDKKETVRMSKLSSFLHPFKLPTVAESIDHT